MDSRTYSWLLLEVISRQSPCHYPQKQNQEIRQELGIGEEWMALEMTSLSPSSVWDSDALGAQVALNLASSSWTPGMTRNSRFSTWVLQTHSTDGAVSAGSEPGIRTVMGWGQFRTGGVGTTLLRSRAPGACSPSPETEGPTSVL